MKFIWNHAYLLMVLTALAWSGNGITGRGLNDIIPPIGLAFWRWVVAFPIVMIIAWPHVQKDLPKVRENWLILMVLSILSITAYNTLLYYGLLTTTAINALLINTSRPVIIVLLSILFFQQGITPKQGFGFLLASIGTLAIIIKAEILKPLIYCKYFYISHLHFLLIVSSKSIIVDLYYISSIYNYC
jgi:drug/metabolite transporter (DMT)-like permease